MKAMSAHRYLLPLFFVLTLLLGLYVYQDYGVHWDEYNNQQFGLKWKLYCLETINNGSVSKTPLPTIELMDRLHGPFIETTLSFIKDVLNLSDLRDILLFRHLSCFVLFLIGLWAFYLLCRHHFKNKYLALLGCVFLLLSPRIFAHAFYDTFDIPFLSFYTLSIYTLLRLLDQKTFFNALLHALCCAVLIDIRLIGFVVVFVTFLFYLIDILQISSFQEKIRTSLPLLLYTFLIPLAVIAGWPLLWSDPVSNFKLLINEMFHVNFSYSILYLGKVYLGPDLPWHYAPVWILISTPLFYTLHFCIGLLAAVWSVFKPTPFIQRRNELIFLLLFIVPLLLSTGKIYDGWRHLFFIYPLFLIFSLTALNLLWNSIHSLQQKTVGLFCRNLLIAATAAALLQTTYVMIRNHPFQYTYLNKLAQIKNLNIRHSFELDYWGLSYKQALEYILKNDNDPLIPISLGNLPWPMLYNNINILPVSDRERFTVVSFQQAKYFLSNYRQHPEEFPYPEYLSIKAFRTKILGIYKLK